MTHRHSAPNPCCGSSLSRFVLSDAERHYERDRPFAIEHVQLHLELHPEARSISGAATLDFVRTGDFSDQLRLDAVGFTIEQVRLLVDESPVPTTVEYDGQQLSIAIAPGLTRGAVEVTYRATPRRGLYFLEPDEMVPARPRQVWSQCQDEDARHWFPCHDAPHMKSTTELCVTVPAGWLALSNGTCIEQSSEPTSGQGGAGRATFHYRLDEPHPSYLVTLVAGEFTVLRDRSVKLPSGRSVAIQYLVPIGREADGWRSLGDTPRLIELMSQLIGQEYPYDTYTQVVVHDFVFGGMENTTATTLYEHVLLDARASLDIRSQDLVAHELAHHWFGDCLTCQDWSHAWLNEGFATFFEHIEREAFLGSDEYTQGLLSDLDSYLAESSAKYDRPIVCREYQSPIELFDRHLYEKGGLVLHMLRRLLGDTVFWAAVGDYVRSHQGGVVQTIDLLRALEHRSGRSLDRFFDEWVFGPGYPELTVRAAWEDGVCSVSLTQRPLGGATRPFAIPFEIIVGTADGGTLVFEKLVTTTSATHTIALPARPLYIAFDPNLRITAPVKLELSPDWLQSLLRTPTALRSRLLAARAMGTRHDPKILEALGEVLVDPREPFMLRVECAKALGKSGEQHRLSLLLSAVTADRAEVRRAVATALGRFRTPLVIGPLSELAKGDPSYLVCAEAARALGSSRQPPALPILMGLLNTESWADSIRAGALDGLASLRDPAVLPELLLHTRYGHPSRARRAAISALGRIGADRNVRDHLELLLDDTDPLVRVEVVTALQALGQADATSALEARKAIEDDGRVLRHIREALRDLPSAAPDAQRRLSDELESVKTRLEELEAKLARLEPSESKPSEKGKPQKKPKKKAKAKPARVAPRAPKAKKSSPQRPRKR